MRNIDKIQQMTIDDWFYHVEDDFGVLPTLCFMCVGCDNCKDCCPVGVKMWLEMEV